MYFNSNSTLVQTGPIYEIKIDLQRLTCHGEALNSITEYRAFVLSGSNELWVHAGAGKFRPYLFIQRARPPTVPPALCGVAGRDLAEQMKWRCGATMELVAHQPGEALVLRSELILIYQNCFKSFQMSPCTGPIVSRLNQCFSLRFVLFPQI
ncbi:hypothetical protein EVAR_10971_1 [Eumeta japonica]|uniref:Uncharacterized protein n=1 Tax=Eumeta variegata TaxID=151549 RepID=A0A4C1U5Z8_EUMVA|nr:hypothetical protein EVAR_10971_1 [Eumeta japonica]